METMRFAYESSLSSMCGNQPRGIQPSTAATPDLEIVQLQPTFRRTSQNSKNDCAPLCSRKSKNLLLGQEAAEDMYHDTSYWQDTNQRIADESLGSVSRFAK